MGFNYAAISKGKADGTVKGSITSPFSVLYPTLAEALEGRTDARGNEETPPFSLSVYASDGGIGWALNNRDHNVGLFGAVTRSEDVFGAIEAALEKGEVQARKEKPLPKKAF